MTSNLMKPLLDALTEWERKEKKVPTHVLGGGVLGLYHGLDGWRGQCGCNNTNMVASWEDWVQLAKNILTVNERIEGKP
jgi:hypothetical protein